jgi:hypothetical protein
LSVLAGALVAVAAMGEAGRSDSTGSAGIPDDIGRVPGFGILGGQSWLPTDEKHRFREFRENHDTELPYYAHAFNHLRMALGLRWQPGS